MDELKKALASIRVGDDLDMGLCYLVYRRIKEIARRNSWAAIGPFRAFVDRWLEQEGLGDYADTPGQWGPNRVRLLAAAKKHFGVVE